MKANFMGAVVVALIGFLAGSAAAADSVTDRQASRMDSYAVARGQTTVTGRTAADFSGYYGTDNAQALTSGLRSGKEIQLVGADGSQTSIPQRAPMGNGNVYISMALAQQRLTAAGINQPSATQIQAAMVGGQLTPGGEPVQGVLQMRASGMGWGQIAHSLGVKLGPVVSAMKSANAAIGRSAIQTGTGSAVTAGGNDLPKPKATSGGRSGIVTAGGANVEGSKASDGKRGIVTGAGATSSGVSAAGAGKGQEVHGAGVIAGGGGGQGNAYGRGGK